MTDLMDLGEIHAADIERVRKLIIPEALPAAKPCERCERVFCICPKEAA